MPRKRNRGAAMALAIFAPEHAPAGIEPFDVRYGHVFCVIDPAEPDAGHAGRGGSAGTAVRRGHARRARGRPSTRHAC